MDLDALADELRSAGALTVRADGHDVALTHLDHVLWPSVGDDPAVTKREFLAYLAAVSPWMLLHARHRIVTLAGYRDASRPPLYFQRHRDDVPPFVETVRAYAESYGVDQTYVLCNNLATLLWLGQINNLALHVSLFRVVNEDGGIPSESFSGSEQAVERSVLHRPDLLLFDLDPYIYAGDEAPRHPPRVNRTGWNAVREVAYALKELLDAVALPSFVKTSGATGLHVVVPIVRDFTFETTQALCSNFASALEARRRDVTTAWAIDARRGKVFIDCRQNGYSKSLAAPYSPRAEAGAPVSMPLTWDELASVYPTDFTIRTVLARLRERGDAWASLGSAAVDLAAVIR